MYMGTCSWKYPSWAGLVYSSPKPENFLREYSRQFNSVEIDQWFWSLFDVDKIKLPDISTVEEYVKAVEDVKEFRFTIKVPNSITLTHFYRKSGNEPLRENPYFFSVELFMDFLERLRPMWGKIGALMFQFEYLNKQKMAGLSEFLHRLEEFVHQLPAEFPYAFEIRNPNYLGATYFSFLQKHRLSCVLLDGYYMPPAWQVFDRWHSFLVSPVVFRLHGPDREGIEELTGERWNRRVLVRDEDLDRYAERIRRLLNEDVDVYVNVNNHYEGSAPLTIQRLKEKIGQEYK